MLAYVFWHQPSASAAADAYESALAAFHRRLAEASPQGFIESWAFRVEGPAWLPNQAGYEDWYLLESSAAIDGLDGAIRDSLAATTDLGAAHEDVAGLAYWATGTLLRPRGRRSGHLSAAASAVWLDKPFGMSYEVALRRMEASAGPTAVWWQRTLSLGPSPEFCLPGAGLEALPHEWKGVLSIRRPIYRPEGS